MKIKVATDRVGGTREMEAIPTPVPELFITPAYFGEDELEPDDAFVLTHLPTGYKCGSVYPKAECHRLAELMAESDIPWAEIRAPEDAKRWKDHYRAVMIKFEAGV